MDLALHLGMTAGGLKRVMSEREFQQWQGYAARRMLPGRRLELLLAQVSMLIAQTMGGAKNVALRDFMFEPREQEPDNDGELSAEDVAAFFKATLVKPRKD